MDEVPQSAPPPAPRPWRPWLAVTGLAVLFSLRWLADTWWVAACGTAWSVHAGLLLVLACLIRVRRAPLAAVVALLLFGVLVGARWTAIPRLAAAEAADPDSGDAAAALRITVANQGYWNRGPQTAAALLATAPDLLVLIETSAATEEALRQGRQWGGEAGSSMAEDPFGWACFCAWPVRVEPVTAMDPGMAALIHVARPSAPFRVIVMHPPPPIGSQGHAVHGKILAGIANALPAGGVPTLVVGDANATPDLPALRRLAAAGGLARATPALGGSWPSYAGPCGMAIDHILADAAWRRIAAGTIRVPGSDHLGRTAVLVSGK